MVATIACLTAGFDGKYFTEPKASDYYVGEEQFRGEWFGGIASKLKLRGAVDASEFSRVLAGRHPSTGRGLIKSHAPNRVPGVDMTFSAPKDVSVLWALGDKKTREAIEAAMTEAVRDTLAYIEDNLDLVRRGRGGHIFEKGKLLAAMFPHFTNRNGEPEVHIHAVITNLVLTQDNKYQHINTWRLFEWTRTLGPMFRAELASRLRTKLGLEIELARDEKGRERSWFEVPGVCRKLCDTWSSRRKEIEQLIDPEWGCLAQARSNANRISRKSKSRLPHIDQLQRRWEEQAQEHGFGRRNIESLLHKASTRNPARGLQQAIDDSVKKLIQGEAHFEYRELLRNVTERVQHIGLTGREIAKRLDETLSTSQSLITLAGEGVNRRFTTRDVWRLEEAFLKNIESLRKRRGARVSERKLLEVLKSRMTLGADQAAAIRELTQGSESIRLMQGVAGAGKSYALNAVREAFTKSGYHVIGGALSAVAKEELEGQAGIKSRTVASYLYHLDRSLGRRIADRIIRDLKASLAGKPLVKERNPVELGKKTVLVLDEAGMLDTRSLNRILRHAVKAKATVILVGDDKQLQPIDAGGPFRHLLKKLRPAQLTENRRQRNTKDRLAVQAVRDGKASEAIKNYYERGLVTVGENRGETVRKLVEEWGKAGGVRKPEHHTIFVETRREAALINRLCQTERLAERGDRTPASIARGENRFYHGDRVLFHKADRLRGIENGYRGTVVKVDRLRRQLHVRLDRPKKNHPAVVRLSASSLTSDSITLGYASTTHKMQGQTTEHSYVLLGGGMADRNMAYTQLTRGKHSTRLFIDQLSAGEDFKDIARRIGKERAKTLAHDHAIHHSPNLEQ